MISLAKYSTAAGRTNTKGMANAAQITQARNTSMGHNMTSSARSNSASFGTAGPKPSWEGYQPHTSARIQLANSGYDCKPNARARAFAPNGAALRNISHNPLVGATGARSGVVDYRFSGSRGDNSINRLSSRMRINSLT